MRHLGNFRLALTALAAGLMMLSLTNSSRADLTFTGSGGGFSAQANFSLSGSTLTVTLTDTSTAAVSSNGQTLGGLFFNTTTALTANSAALNAGSFTAFGSIVNNVGEGWLYGHGSSVTSSGFNSTIAAAGYTIGFGDAQAQAFYTTPVTPLDGADYALVGTGGVTPNGGLKSPLFQNSLVFTLTVGSGFSLSELGNTVRFQMGTALSETNFEGHPTAVPEPSTLAIAGLGALGFMGYGLRRRAANRQ